MEVTDFAPPATIDMDCADDPSYFTVVPFAVIVKAFGFLRAVYVVSVFLTENTPAILLDCHSMTHAWFVVVMPKRSSVP